MFPDLALACLSAGGCSAVSVVFDRLQFNFGSVAVQFLPRLLSLTFPLLPRGTNREALLRATDIALEHQHLRVLLLTTA